jgi:hypothetical protein
MDRSRRLFALPALSALALALGCAGPRIPAPIEDIPLCPDFTIGHTKMAGSLRYPVRLRVLDGKTLLFKTVISGFRHANDPRPQSYIADDSAKYTVEWAQCSNPRAPHAASEPPTGPKAHEKAREGEGSYECGEATVYKADGILTTRKGDKASHVIKFLPPPNPACWVDEAGPIPDVDAGTAPIDAGAAVVDAGASPVNADAGPTK